MKTTMIAISLTALALAGCGHRDDDAPAGGASEAATADGAMGAGASAGATGSVAMNAGQDFVDTAAASDQFEIAISKLAEKNAASAKVKTFAAQMVRAHTDSTAALKAAAGEASPAITPAPHTTPTQQAALDSLSSKTGDFFDKAYATAQVDAHQKTLDALKGYAANGSDASLKAFATKMIPVVTAHLNMAKAL